jgi:hypothetical protein
MDRTIVIALECFVNHGQIRSEAPLNSAFFCAIVFFPSRKPACKKKTIGLRRELEQKIDRLFYFAGRGLERRLVAGSGKR